MQERRRKAVVIVEMLTMVMVILITGGLVMLSLEALLEAHDRVADRSNRYATISDLLTTLRADVRQADTAEFGTATTDDGAQQVLTLRRADGDVVYRTSGHRVTRSSGAANGAFCEWDDPDLTVRWPDASAPAGKLVRMVLTWNPTRPHDTAPVVEFDITIATAGERRERTADDE